ncbi:MAG: sigma-70 family RNA polymerase sigma factor [Defluviitaleaceae bacterium]|nr:sigma-70 family RNA polymerase sigma factor [Defluviitaleaceae bacterium]
MNDIHNLSDYEVVRQCLDEDKEAFAEIVSRYKSLVYSIVLKMVGNTDEANDIAQEIFIKAYKSLSRYSPDYRFSTWIMRIATNHVIDCRRKKRSETVPMEDCEAELGRTAASARTPEQELVRREDSQAIRGLLCDLPDIYKIPIVLFHQQGMSYQEISDIIQEPLSKVKNRIFRGRRMLKDSLIKLGRDSGYGIL